MVTVDEVVIAIAIGLGTAPVSACPSLDIDGNAMITVDEIVRGVLMALGGCPVDPTATPTATASLSPTSPPFTPDPFPLFTDVTQQAGVEYLQHGTREPPDCLLDTFGSHPGRHIIACFPERFSGGVAVADYDNDGWPDIYVTRLDAADILFRNRGDGTFEDVTTASGLDLVRNSNGAAWADVDNDGDLDLYVTTIGYDHYGMFLNDGTGRFSQAEMSRGTAVVTSAQRVGTSVAFGDYDRDGWLDLYVTEWHWIGFAENPTAPSHARLLRNRGKDAPGFFEDATIGAEVLHDDRDTGILSGAFGFTASFADFDDDHWPDLAIAADFGTSRLFWNGGDGRFTDGTSAAGVGSDENGMGSAIADYDNDGDLDWFVSSIYYGSPPGDDPRRNGNRLYRNEGGRVFSDHTDAAGVRNGGWGWGAAFFDADNDGDLDLVQLAGIDLPIVATDDSFKQDPVRFWINDGTGTMTEMAAAVGLANAGGGKSLAILDYDRDGDLDLFIVNNGGYPRLYRNDGRYGDEWLRLRLVGTQSNRGAVGARVTLLNDGHATQMREIGGGGEFQAQSEATAHFGLGRVRRVDRVIIRWPSGLTQTLHDVSPNQELVVIEPES